MHIEDFVFYNSQVLELYLRVMLNTLHHVQNVLGSECCGLLCWHWMSPGPILGLLFITMTPRSVCVVFVALEVFCWLWDFVWDHGALQFIMCFQNGSSCEPDFEYLIFSTLRLPSWWMTLRHLRGLIPGHRCRDVRFIQYSICFCWKYVRCWDIMMCFDSCSSFAEGVWVRLRYISQETLADPYWSALMLRLAVGFSSLNWPIFACEMSWAFQCHASRTDWLAARPYAMKKELLK